MDLSDVFRSLVRRWYVTVPMLVVTLALAATAFMQVRPEWERQANLVLLPARDSVPEAGNPYLYLSGLSNVADVLLRASSSQEILQEIADEHSGATVELARDPTTASPILTVVVSAVSDDVAAGAMKDVIARVGSTLESLQEEEGLSAEERISVVPLAVDRKGTMVQRDRLLTAGAVLAGGLVLSVVVPAAVEGLSISRRRRIRQAGPVASSEGATGEDVQEGDATALPNPKPARKPVPAADAGTVSEVKPTSKGIVKPASTSAVKPASKSTAKATASPSVKTTANPHAKTTANRPAKTTSKTSTRTAARSSAKSASKTTAEPSPIPSSTPTHAGASSADR